MENVYQAPESDISTVDNDATQPVKLFNAKGRMGRIRYIFYTTFVPFIAYVVMAIVMAIMIPAVADSGSKAFGVIAALLAIGFLIFLLVVLFLATIQRCHDFDTSGWLSLIILLPIIPIIFWFIPGTKGENKYGV